MRGERDLLSALAARPSRATASAGAAWLVVASAVLWGTTGTSRALVGVPVSALTVGLLRLVVGGVALAALAPIGRRVDRRALRQGRAPLVLAAVSVAAYQPLFFTAVGTLGVAVGTIVAIGSAPLAAGVIAALVERRAPGRAWSVGTALALVGGVLLLVPDGGVRLSVVGVAAAVGAGASYALYASGSQRLLDAGVAPGVAMAAVFAGGALLLTPALALPGVIDEVRAVLGQGRGIALVAWLGLATVALSYRLFARGLGRVRIETVATLSLAEPLTAALLGVALLGETLTRAGALGALAVLAGLVVTARPGPRRDGAGQLARSTTKRQTPASSTDDSRSV